MAASDTDLLDETLPDTARSAPWPLLNRLPALLADARGSPGAYRELLRQAHEELKVRFLAEEPVESLVQARALLVDTVLRAVWSAQSVADTASCALVGVGGYGRCELRPWCGSDISLVVPESA